MRHAWPFLFVLPAALLAAAAQQATPARVDFVRDVQPLLAAHCLGCHGPGKQMNGLRLDRRRDALRGGTRPVIAAGNSAGSNLYLRLAGDPHAGVSMPPTGRLSADEISVIKAWIDQGAVWPDAASGEHRPAIPAAEVEAAAAAVARLRAGEAVDPGLANLRGADGTTVLMATALYGSASELEQQLARGGQVNASNESGATALMWAVDDLAKTRLLIAHGAAVNARSSSGRTPLLIAAGLPQGTAVVKLLLEHGANTAVSAPKVPLPVTPLVEAAEAANAESIRLLLTHGAQAGPSAGMALAHAVAAGCRACFEELAAAYPQAMTQALVLDSPPGSAAEGWEVMRAHGARTDVPGPGGLTAAVAAGFVDFPAAGVRVQRTPPGLPPGAYPPAPPVAPAAQPNAVPAAVARALPLLQHTDGTFLAKSGCVSCHNNVLTATSVATARTRGFAVDSRQAAASLQIIAAYMGEWRGRALEGFAIPGDADTVAALLVGMAAAGQPADTTTDAFARYLKDHQLPDGNWMPFAHRPPISSNAVTIAAQALRALQTYAPPRQQREYAAAEARATAWLVAARPASTDGLAHQVLGLVWSGTSGATALPAAVAALLRLQHEDGGWGQLPGRDSDAFATGEVLVALQQAGRSRQDHAVKQGLAYLLRTQLADGTWRVHTRALPIQPPFDAGFPGGRDQWISAAATNWAVTALMISSPVAAPRH